MNISRKIILTLIAVFLVWHTNALQAQVPDTNCYDAGVFCDSASMYGPWTLPDKLSGNGFQICSTSIGGAGSSNNQLFFPFVPCKSHVKIELEYSYLQEQPGFKKGYQYGITYDCPSETTAENDYIVCDGSQITAKKTIIEAYSFEPGHTYYLYIDGYDASKMIFTLKVLDGIGCLDIEPAQYYSIEDEEPYVPVGDTVSLCQDGMFELEAHGITNASKYIWYLQDTIITQDSAKLNIKFEGKDSIYEICSQGYTDCGVSAVNCFYVKVDTLEDQFLPDTGYCASELSNGVIPNGWLGGKIRALASGDFTYNVVLDNGCHYRQHIHITRYPEPVISKDSIICGMDSLVNGSMVIKNGDMVKVDTFTEHGCKSEILNRYFFFNFEGDISALQCADNNTLQLSIVNIQYDTNRYNKIVVDWYKDSELIASGNGFTLRNVDSRGKYSATVRLFQSYYHCSFDLDTVEINFLPEPGFIFDNDTICSSDSFYIAIENYNPGFTYEVNVEGAVAKDLGNGRFSMKWGGEGDYTITVKCIFGDCEFQQSKSVHVKRELEVPYIDCTKSTNNSIVFDWITSPGVSKYEVWIDGSYRETVTSGPYTVNGLNYGQEVAIKVKTLCNCICEDKADSNVCKALDCPDHTVRITGLPDELCYDEIGDTIHLGYYADTIGLVHWKGDAVDSTGIIYKDLLSVGDNHIRLEYVIGDCVYPVDTMLTVFPPLEVEYSVTDNSCYNTQDGQFIIDFSNVDLASLMINGTLYDSMYITGLSGGDYHFVATDINGCTFEDDFMINTPPDPDLDIYGEDFVKFNTSYQYYIEPDIDIAYKRWIKYGRMDTVVLCENCDTVTIVPEDDFILCVEVQYDSVCTKVECLEVRMDRESKIYAPNIFTPNSDGINDVFNITSSNGLPVNVKTLKIFNRWGDLVYRADNFIVGATVKSGWDGRYNGELATTGVYVYYVEIVEENGDITKFYGDVTLIR